MGMLPVQDDAGFHEGGQHVHLTEVYAAPFRSGSMRTKPQISPIINVDFAWHRARVP
jgi:hypothetical protein